MNRLSSVSNKSGALQRALARPQKERNQGHIPMPRGGTEHPETLAGHSLSRQLRLTVARFGQARHSQRRVRIRTDDGICLTNLIRCNTKLARLQRGIVALRVHQQGYRQKLK